MTNSFTSVVTSLTGGRRNLGIKKIKKKKKERKKKKTLDRSTSSFYKFSLHAQVFAWV